MTYTHYSLAPIEHGDLARGMYSRSRAYETADLAREYGRASLVGARSRGLVALVRVETQDAWDHRGEPYRAMVRETILEMLPEPAEA